MLLVLGAVDAALAQPFGMTRGAPPPEVGGFTGWILAKQAEFYRMMSGTIRAAKADGSAAWTLLGISFLYGIFHAAGPGHGKAVISSYLVANNETWRRGVVLSFASAMLQAFTAIAIVGIAAVLLGATAKTMGNTVRVIEIVSYALIVLIGLRLLWVKGRALPASAAAARARTITITRTITHHGHAITRTIMATTIIMTTTMTRKLPPGAMPMRRSRSELAGRALAAARLVGHRRGRLAAVLGRHHRAGVRAGAGAVLDRRRLDLRDGARHRDHGRRHRHPRGRRARAGRAAGQGQARRRHAARCAASRPRRPR